MRTTRGFSIAEALVATLITTIVLLGAAAFFSAIGRHADREAGRSPGVGGPTDAALARLERDLQLAEALPRASGRVRAGSQTLLLRLQDDSVVAWRQEGSVLLRGVRDDRHRFDDRVVLDRVAFVDLRLRSATVFEAAISRRKEPARKLVVLLRNLGASDEAPDGGDPHGAWDPDGGSRGGR